VRVAPLFPLPQPLPSGERGDSPSTCKGEGRGEGPLPLPLTTPPQTFSYRFFLHSLGYHNKTHTPLLTPVRGCLVFANGVGIVKILPALHLMQFFRAIDSLN